MITDLINLPDKEEERMDEWLATMGIDEHSCCRCGIKPENPLAIQPFFAGGQYFPMCPICALRTRNEMHGLPPDTPFQGEMAQQMYEDFVEDLENEYFDRSY